MKKVLILCTGNSCRSIIAEALVNAKLEGVEAWSAGVRASGKVNAYAKKVLEEEGIWKACYHSKTLDEVLHVDFDLVVTVCDHAKEHCPMFPRKTKTLHVGFSDPDGKDYGAFILTYQAIEAELLPSIQKELGNV
jgi:arsenate reductase